MSIKETVEKNIVWWSLVMLVAGFASGVAVYKTALQITNQATLTNGTFISTDELNDKYVLKSDSVSQVDLNARYVPKELCATRQPMKFTQSQAEPLRTLLAEGKRLLTASTAKYFSVLWHHLTLNGEVCI